jgi:hypothetical protein
MLFLAATMTLVLVAGCGNGEPTAHSERQAPKDPQKVLDSATQVMEDTGTGSYVIEIPGMAATFEGKFDLDEPFISQALTTRPPDPDLPNGFTVRSLSFKDEMFVRVSAGPASKCWMRYEADDAAAAHGVTDLGALQPSDVMWTTPPAAEILRNPTARGFTSKNTSTEINAEVDLVAAFSAAMPKAANLLAEEIVDKDLTAPVVFTVVDGRYTGASYTGEDLMGPADISAADLRKAGLSGEGVSPKQALGLFSSLEVQIKYGEFGQEVELVRPKKDEIAEVDLATMSENDTLTCKVAQR